MSLSSVIIEPLSSAFLGVLGSNATPLFRGKSGYVERCASIFDCWFWSNMPADAYFGLPPAPSGMVLFSFRFGLWPNSSSGTFLRNFDLKMSF